MLPINSTIVYWLSHLLQMMIQQWYIITQSPQFTLGFVLDIVHPVELVKCTHYYTKLYNDGYLSLDYHIE